MNEELLITYGVIVVEYSHSNIRLLNNYRCWNYQLTIVCHLHEIQMHLEGGLEKRLDRLLSLSFFIISIANIELLVKTHQPKISNNIVLELVDREVFEDDTEPGIIALDQTVSHLFLSPN